MRAAGKGITLTEETEMRQDGRELARFVGTMRVILDHGDKKERN